MLSSSSSLKYSVNTCGNHTTHKCNVWKNVKNHIWTSCLKTVCSPTLPTFQKKTVFFQTTYVSFNKTLHTSHLPQLFCKEMSKRVRRLSSYWWWPQLQKVQVKDYAKIAQLPVEVGNVQTICFHI